MATNATVGFDPHSTIGALEIGVLVATFLYGLVTVQTFMYFKKFPNDTWILKLLVSVVWLLDLVHTISISHTLYSATISFYAHLASDNHSFKPQGLYVTVLFGGLVTLLCQGFFSVCIHNLFPTPYLAIICYILGFARCVGCFALAAEGFVGPTLEQFVRDWRWLITALLCVGPALDIIIAICMCYYVSKQRERVREERTMRVLDLLMQWTVQTGLLTSIAAVATVILFQTMPNNFIWLAAYVILAKLYSNSLMSALNSRTKLRKSLPSLTTSVPTGPRTSMRGKHDSWDYVRD